MKYVILIYGNPDSRAIWEGMSSEQRAAGLDYYGRLVEELADSGELVVSEALADPSQTTRISTEGGRMTTADGPFPEAKELLAGFFLVECASRERALEIAARIPEAALGLVEARPVMSLADFEL